MRTQKEKMSWKGAPISGNLHLFPELAITNFHKSESFKPINLLSHIPGGWKCEPKSQFPSKGSREVPVSCASTHLVVVNHFWHSPIGDSLILDSASVFTWHSSLYI